MTNEELEKLRTYAEKGYFTCFRSGVWTDSGGKKHDITQGDLDAMASQFETLARQGHKVPLMIGHPKDKEPEQGKINSISRFGDFLLAKAADVKEDILDKIKKGLFKFVSVAFNRELQLQHIGITNNPAVDGLLPITPAFANFEKENTIVFSFEQTWMGDEPGLQGQEKDDNLKNQNIVLKEEHMSNDPGANAPTIKPNDETAALKNKLARFEKEKMHAENNAKAAEQMLADMKRQSWIGEISTFTSGLLEKKKLFPNEIEPMNEYLFLQDDNETYLFSNDAQQETPFQFMKRFLEGLPERLPLEAIKDPGKTTDQDSDNACFSRINPDEDNLELHNRAKALMAKEKISYEAALARLEG